MLTPEEKSLAAAGILSPWVLYDAQKEVYIHQSQHRFPFCEMNRRFGKTFTTYLRLHETLSRNKNWVARWCEPWKNQCREILQPEIQKINALLPESMRPVWKTTDSFYEFPYTGSRLYLRGVNEDKGESARGAFSNIIVLDEVGSYKDTSYIVNEVLLPQLLTTKGQMIMIGTPPRKLDHEYYKYKQQAIESGQFVQKTIIDCNWFDEEDVEQMCKAVGGRDSAAWRREFLCEPVAESDTLVVPEFQELDHVRDQINLPKHFDIYVSMDSGFHDHTAALIAVVDFLKAKVYVIDELFVKSQNSEQISTQIKDKIKLHFGTKVPYRWVCDAPAQVIYDMNTLHQMPFVAPLKDDKFAAINAMRLKFQENRIEIHRRCQNLTFQCKVGMWNDSKKDFERGELVGHLDSIAALVYLLRTVDWSKNPYPRFEAEVNASDYWINEEPDKGQELANQMFPFAKGGR